jgi:hypothetical protein
MNSTSTLTTVITGAMKTHATGGGYKKDKLNYRRRRGETLQVVNFQLSKDNTAGEARCYVNLAIAFDAIFALMGQRAPAELKEYQGHFRARLEEIAGDAPPHWLVNAATDTSALGIELDAPLARAAEFLDAVDGPRAMLARVPLDQGAQNYLKAQLHYVNRDFDAALVAVRAGVAFFADRGATVRKAIHDLHLEELL